MFSFKCHVLKYCYRWYVWTCCEVKNLLTWSSRPSRWCWWCMFWPTHGGVNAYPCICLLACMYLDVSCPGGFESISISCLQLRLSALQLFNLHHHVDIHRFFLYTSRFFPLGYVNAGLLIAKHQSRGIAVWQIDCWARWLKKRTMCIMCFWNWLEQVTSSVACRPARTHEMTDVVFTSFGASRLMCLWLVFSITTQDIHVSTGSCSMSQPWLLQEATRASWTESLAYRCQHASVSTRLDVDKEAWQGLHVYVLVCIVAQPTWMLDWYTWTWEEYALPVQCTVRFPTYTTTLLLRLEPGLTWTAS